MELVMFFIIYNYNKISLDNMGTLSKKQIISVIILGILVLVIPIGVFLVQKTTIFKSKAASAPIIDALEIKDNDGTVINCDSLTNPPTCPTSTIDVTIKLTNPNALVPAATMQQ